MPDPEPQALWKLQFGANFRAANCVEFCVWAPKLRELELSLGPDGQRIVPMTAGNDGEFTAVVPNLEPGTDYKFRTSAGTLYPDPVSRWQPHGVHGASRVVDSDSFRWSDQAWKGIPLKNYLIYELHTGTFTQEGTFEAIIPRLAYLRELGITAVELMPVAQFPGCANWGYDGVGLYTPQSTYGGPHGLKTLVDACHREGLAVVLDVMYNHLGPEGNYWNAFAPSFTSAYQTPWGQAINFDDADSDGVRRFYIDNALYWLTEYHIDALRLDAIHGIYDTGPRHVLEEMAQAFHGQAASLGRQAFLIAECDRNDVRVVRPRTQGGYGLDAQWHDDFHHSLYTLLTGNHRGYLSDFGKLEDLKKSIGEGFVYDGKRSPYRRRRHGSSSRDVAGEHFVACIQNHDQIANASSGRRLASLVSLEQQKLAAAILLCSPFLPLLFMGQEYGEIAPFHYFTSHSDPQLAEAVRAGRLAEFQAFSGDGPFADPQDPATFEHSKLNWRLLQEPPHAGILRLYQDLIFLRANHPCLANCRKDLTAVVCDEEARWMTVERRDPSSSRAGLLCNFSSSPRAIPVSIEDGKWLLALWTGALHYGGVRGEGPMSVIESAGEVVLSGYAAALYTDRIIGPPDVRR